MEFRRAKDEDIPAILDVQAANFIGNLSDAERQDGFLSVKFTRRQFEEMASHVGVIIAAAESGLAGYLCASSCEFNRSFPLLAAMMRQFDAIDYRGRSLTSSRVFIYGPVCIDRSYRGRGLLRGLYETLLQEVVGRYDIGVAFVAGDNPHSLLVHVDGLGMTHVGEFTFSGKQYRILAFAVRCGNEYGAASKPTAEEP
jgi:L-amino acid N-acyltransferase YncA